MWILTALIGLTVGAVLNVLADDLPPDEQGERGPLRPPHCQVCGHWFAPAHWLAVFHFLQGRQCHHCGARRRWRSLIVELVSAIMFTGLWFWAQADVGRFYAAATVSTIFLLITIIDIEHRLILWRVVWVSALILLIIGIASPDRGWQKTLIGAVVGYGLVFGLFLLGQGYMWLVARWRGQPLDEIAFGGGDVNLAGLIGLALGWSGVLIALFVGILAGGLFSLGYITAQLVRGKYNPHSAIPYGPFLVLGAMLVYLFGRNLLTPLAGPTP